MRVAGRVWVQFSITCESFLGAVSCLGSVMHGAASQILADKCRGVDSPH